jgi:hypothetical protein
MAKPIKKATVYFRPLVLTDENFNRMKTTPEEFSEMTRLSQMVTADDAITEGLEIEKVEIVNRKKDE